MELYVQHTFKYIKKFYKVSRQHEVTLTHQKSSCQKSRFLSAFSLHASFAPHSCVRTIRIKFRCPNRSHHIHTSGSSGSFGSFGSQATVRSLSHSMRHLLSSRKFSPTNICNLISIYAAPRPPYSAANALGLSFNYGHGWNHGHSVMAITRFVLAI